MRGQRYKVKLAEEKRIVRGVQLELVKSRYVVAMGIMRLLQ
jgi:hypothetical protein